MNGRCVYAQLMAQMYLRGYDSQSLAKKTQMAYTSLRRKLRGEGTLKLEEALRIRQALGCDLPLETLFERRDIAHDR